MKKVKTKFLNLLFIGGLLIQSLYGNYTDIEKTKILVGACYTWTKYWPRINRERTNYRKREELVKNLCTFLKVDNLKKWDEEDLFSDKDVFLGSSGILPSPLPGMGANGALLPPAQGNALFGKTFDEISKNGLDITLLGQDFKGIKTPSAFRKIMDEFLYEKLAKTFTGFNDRYTKLFNSLLELFKDYLFLVKEKFEKTWKECLRRPEFKDLFEILGKGITDWSVSEKGTVLKAILFFSKNEATQEVTKSMVDEVLQEYDLLNVLDTFEKQSVILRDYLAQLKRWNEVAPNAGSVKSQQRLENLAMPDQLKAKLKCLQSAKKDEDFLKKQKVEVAIDKKNIWERISKLPLSNMELKYQDFFFQALERVFFSVNDADFKEELATDFIALGKAGCELKPIDWKNIEAVKTAYHEFRESGGSKELCYVFEQLEGYANRTPSINEAINELKKGAQRLNSIYEISEAAETFRKFGRVIERLLVKRALNNESDKAKEDLEKLLGRLHKECEALSAKYDIANVHEMVNKPENCTQAIERLWKLIRDMGDFDDIARAIEKLSKIQNGLLQIDVRTTELLIKIAQALSISQVNAKKIGVNTKAVEALWNIVQSVANLPANTQDLEILKKNANQIEKFLEFVQEVPFIESYTCPKDVVGHMKKKLEKINNLRLTSSQLGAEWKLVLYKKYYEETEKYSLEEMTENVNFWLKLDTPFKADEFDMAVDSLLQDLSNTVGDEDLEGLVRNLIDYKKKLIDCKDVSLEESFIDKKRAILQAKQLLGDDLDIFKLLNVLKNGIYVLKSEKLEPISIIGVVGKGDAVSNFNRVQKTENYDNQKEKISKKLIDFTKTWLSVDRLTPKVFLVNLPWPKEKFNRAVLSEKISEKLTEERKKKAEEEVAQAAVPGLDPQNPQNADQGASEENQGGAANDLEKVKTELEAKQKEQKAAKKQLETENKIINTKEEEIRKLDEKIKELKEEIERLKQTLKGLRQEVEDLGNEKEGVANFQRRTMEDKEAIIKGLETQLEDARSENDSLASREQANIEAARAEVEKEMQKLQSELDETRMISDDLRTKSENAENALKAASADFERKEKDMQGRLEQIEKKLQEYQKKEQDLRSDLTKKEKESQSLNKQLSAVNQAKTAAEQKAQNLDSRVKELEDQNKALKEENEALKNRSVRSSGSTIIRNDNEESQALKSELDQMRAKSENKERALKQKDNHIQTLENTVANLRRQVAEVKEQAKANRSRSRDVFGSETDDLSLQRQQLSTVRQELIEKNEALQKLQMNLNEREKSLNSREKAVKAVENERATTVKRGNSGNATEKVLPNDIQFGIGDTSGNVNVVPGTQVHVPMKLPLQIEDAQKSERLESPILQHRSVNDRSLMMPNRAR